MPALTTTELTRYRTFPQASKRYLYPFVPTVIFAAKVTSAPSPGAVVIPYNTVTVGSYTAIEGGESLRVDFVAGGRASRLRVRSATAAHLVVSWDSDIVWANGMNLTVYREFLPWRKQQRTTGGVTYKDYDVAWTDQTVKWPPVAMMGDPIIKLMRAGDPAPQLYMADRGSYAMAPAATLTGHAWAMPGGTPATSAATTPGLVTVSAPIKDYWKYTVTDSNGKATLTRRPVVVVDPANCYTEFVCESLEDNIDTGCIARFRVFGSATAAEFPTKGCIFYFTEDYYGAGHGEHIRFFGYIVERSVRKDPETGDTAFTAVSSVSIADRLVVSASELHDVVTPANWQEGKSITVRHSLFYLIYFHSTLFEVADVFIADDPTPDWFTDYPEGTLWGLLNSLARAWRAFRCGVTKRGRVVIGVDPQMRPLANRTAAVTEVCQLAEGDWTGQIDVPISDYTPSAFLDLQGSYYDGVPGTDKEALVLSIAPGHPDKEFGAKESFPGMSLNGQLEGNQFAGLMLGQKNNPYGTFRIELVGNWWEAFEPALQEYVRAPVLGWLTNAFPTLLANARLVVRGMSQSDAGEGVQQTTLTVEVESFAEQAVDGDYPPPFQPPCDTCPPPCVNCTPVLPTPPSVDFSADTRCAVDPVTFTAVVTGGTPTGYLWDFGDGETSTDGTPTHTYAGLGPYTVTLGVDFLEGDYVTEIKAAYISAEFCAPVETPQLVDYDYCDSGAMVVEIDWYFDLDESYDDYDTAYLYKSSTGPSSGFVKIYTDTDQNYYGLDTDVIPGHTYWYKVQAKINGLLSAFSTVTAVIVGIECQVVVTATACTPASTDITLSWAAMLGATGYKVYRATSSGGSYSLIGTTAASPYVDSTGDEQTTYYYKVRPYDAIEDGNLSAYVSATTCCAQSAWHDHLIFATTAKVYEWDDFGGYGYTTSPNDITGNITGTLLSFRITFGGDVVVLSTDGAWIRTGLTTWVGGLSADDWAALSALWSYSWFAEDGTGPHGHALWGCRGVCTTGAYPCNTPQTPPDDDPLIHWAYVVQNAWVHLIGDYAVEANHDGTGFNDCSTQGNGLWKTPLVSGAPQALSISDGTPPDVLDQGGLSQLSTASAPHFSPYAIEDFHDFVLELHFGSSALYFDNVDITTTGTQNEPAHFTDSNGDTWAWGAYGTFASGYLYRGGGAGFSVKLSVGLPHTPFALNAPPATDVRRAVTDTQMWKTTDNGLNWIAYPAPPDSVGIYTGDGELDRLYVVDGDGNLWLSEDEGAHWCLRFTNPGGTASIGLWVDTSA